MKKTVRRLSAALLALILAVTLLAPALAAGETDDTSPVTPDAADALPVITGIIVEDDQLTWDPVPGADSYMLNFYYPAAAADSIGGRKVTECSVDL